MTATGSRTLWTTARASRTPIRPTAMETASETPARWTATSMASPTRRTTAPRTTIRVRRTSTATGSATPAPTTTAMALEMTRTTARPRTTRGRQIGRQRRDACDNCFLVPNPDQQNSGLPRRAPARRLRPDDPNWMDNCPLVANPDQVDSDGVGWRLCENDSDGDGVTNQKDNCPMHANPDQQDSNGNGVGDACDTDFDGDGVADGKDNCPGVYNPDQADWNMDQNEDACSDWDGDGTNDKNDNHLDGEPLAGDIDDDGWGNPRQLLTDPNRAAGQQLQRSGQRLWNDADGGDVSNAADNCWIVFNPDQVDSDGDGAGDACENDIDGDGFKNGEDNRLALHPEQQDSNFNGVGTSARRTRMRMACPTRWTTAPGSSTPTRPTRTRTALRRLSALGASAPCPPGWQDPRRTTPEPCLRDVLDLPAS